MGALGVGANGGYLFTRQQGDVVVGLACLLNGVKSGAANQVIGYKPPQFAVRSQTVTDHHRERRRAVEHPCVTQWRQGMRVERLNAFP